MRIAIIVPTTARPALVTRIQRRQRLPRSYVSTDADYRPLPEISGRYDDFVGPAGPLRQLLELGDVRFELRMDYVPESGRSWELPVAAAHWFESRGHEVVSDNPDLVIWATGAIQSDLAIQPDDYHVPRKLKLSQQLIERLRAQGASFVFLLPSVPDMRLETAVLPHPTDAVFQVSKLDDAFAALKENSPPPPVPLSELADPEDELIEATGVAPARRWMRGNLYYSAMAVVALAGLIVWSPVQGLLTSAETSKPPAPSEHVLPGSLDASGPQFKPPSTAGDNDTTVVSAPVGSPVLADAAIVLLEHRVPTGKSCIDVIFGNEKPLLREIKSTEGVFPKSEGVGLCALELRNGRTEPIELSLGTALLAHVIKSDRQQAIRVDPGKSYVLRLVQKPRDEIDYVFSVRPVSTDEITTFSHLLTKTGG